MRPRDSGPGGCGWQRAWVAGTCGGGRPKNGAGSFEREREVLAWEGVTGKEKNEKKEKKKKGGKLL